MQIEDSQRINFSHTLFDPDDVLEEENFSSCLNARGMYESRRFAMRLNPRIHRLVDQVVEKSSKGETRFSSEELQAYSTYIHETIHWWQHKGSTSGFVRSMIPPLQTHINMGDLRTIIQSEGPKKPVRIIGLQGELGMLQQSPAGPSANAVVNNFMDTEFYLALTANPAKYDEEVYANNYFDSAGHSFLITYQHVLSLLRTTFDEQGVAVPDPEPITAALQDLKTRKADGYYWGSPIIRMPLGLHHIYEGQARFNQLQFLGFAGSGLTFAEARSEGLLDGVYGEAFAIFLKLTESTEPTAISDPLVALFLLICDLAINPTAGYPLPIPDYEKFFLDADPGYRFTILSQTVAVALPHLRTAIVEYSIEEYWTIAEELCKVAGFQSYRETLEKISSWKDTQPQIAQLIDEHERFTFSQNNIVPRVLFGEFIRFSEDKYQRPDFFCWSGFHLTHGTDTELALWLYHLSLFSDKEDDSRIFARRTRDHDESLVLEVFNQFFASVTLYDLTRQWVLQNGAFDSDYPWLVRPEQEADFKDTISSVFEKHYGARLEAFTAIQPPAIPI